jgi:hypothetical protein
MEDCIGELNDEDEEKEDRRIFFSLILSDLLVSSMQN